MGGGPSFLSSLFNREKVFRGLASSDSLKWTLEDFKDSAPSSSEKALRGGNLPSVLSGFLEKVLMGGLEGGSFVTSFLRGEVTGASLSWSPIEEAGEAHEGISLSHALNRSCEEEINGTRGSSRKGAGAGFSIRIGLASFTVGAGGSGLLRLLKIDFLVETWGLGAAKSLAWILAGKWSSVSSGLGGLLLTTGSGLRGRCTGERGLRGGGDTCRRCGRGGSSFLALASAGGSSILVLTGGSTDLSSFCLVFLLVISDSGGLAERGAWETSSTTFFTFLFTEGRGLTIGGSGGLGGVSSSTFALAFLLPVGLGGRGDGDL